MKRQLYWQSSFFAALMILAVVDASVAQQVMRTDSPTAQIKFPVVPTMESRDLISADNPRDLRARPLDDQSAVSDLLGGIQGEDAAIQVIVNRGRLLTLKEPIAQPGKGGTPVIAIGDPTVLDVELLPNAQMIRVTGKRVGITDLAIVTASGESLSFEIQVVYDLKLLRAHLRQAFPDSVLTLSQLYDHIVVEGQATSTQQVDSIIQTIDAFLYSAQVAKRTRSQGNLRDPGTAPATGGGGEGDPEGEEPTPDAARPDINRPNTQVTLPTPRIINLLRVPGVQQVMLKVRIAELDRTALRRAGTDIWIQDGSGTTLGTQIGGAMSSLLGLDLSQTTTAFGIFPSGRVEVMLQVLRNNQVLNILAEPNLVAMHGQPASFLAGGEFPVPVPQTTGVGGSTITIEFKKFGVQLDFVPFILDDDVIRLRVQPEVSTIDNTIGVTTSGTTVPGINSRQVSTTVELKQGQTLALAGLLQVELDGSTGRIAGLGDLPYIGSMFRNVTHEKTERELIVLVTPVLVDGVHEEDLAPLPGSEIIDPNDCELFLKGKIEGELDPNYRATDSRNRLFDFRRLLEYELTNIHGPYGFSN